MHVIPFKGTDVLRIADQPDDLYWVPHATGGLIVQWNAADSLQELLVVHGPSSEEPVLIVSSEYFDFGEDTVLGVFDDNGHQTFARGGSDWSDEAKFTAKALNVANERLKIALTERGD